MAKTIIISNRLPVTLKKESGKTTYTKSAGGLATSLSSATSNNDYIWIGWPGNYVNKAEEAGIVTELSAKQMSPVFLSADDVKLFYEGFSNSVIWPAFHYFDEYMMPDARYWEAYKRVNYKYCEALKEVYEPGDKIWVHDYHLLILPSMIRQLFPSAKVGFFLHIPFPSFETFRSIPWREPILKGLLGSDLIGFQTYDDAEHFTDSVTRLLGHEFKLHEIKYEGRTVTAEVFPIGIDYDKFARSATAKPVIQEIETLKKTFNETRLILTVDRLDYSKGIPERLKAIDLFFETHPEYREKVSLLVVMVPSRDQVFQYKKLKHEIDELVGQINGKYSVLGWHPVHYHYKQQPFKSLSALYAMCDVAMVTPMRDGMNLVCKEYIASRTNGNGVLILSERAGAARTLTDAIRVNPNNIYQMAEAIHEALCMDEEEQKTKISRMQQLVRKYDVFSWSASFLNRLDAVSGSTQNCMQINDAVKEQIYASYHNSSSRLILLDYDGTLIDFTEHPEAAIPDASLIGQINELASDPNNHLFIVTGRDRPTIGEWFGSDNINIIAEHGVWVRLNGKWKRTIDPDFSWQQQIKPILELYIDRTPGAILEIKDYSFAWHYRGADEELGNLRARELKSTLNNLLHNMNVQLLQGNKVLEIKSSFTNKGYALQALNILTKHSFVLAIGDDTTDEDMFAVLPQNAYAVKVGNQQTCAQYGLQSWREVRQLLKQLHESREVTSGNQ